MNPEPRRAGFQPAGSRGIPGGFEISNLKSQIPGPPEPADRMSALQRDWHCFRRAQSVLCAPMKLFVTGGAGYIGSVYVEEAVIAGHEVTVYDNLSEGHRRAI